MTGQMDLTGVRRDYESHGFEAKDLDTDPFVQFGLWFKTVHDLDVLDANAMTLATASEDGQPSARIVLLKHYDADGFCWYTDSRSHKGRDLAANPRAALLFHWRDISRQVRIQGQVSPLPAEAAESYFHSRPEGSRFSAASSHQSSVVANRAALEDAVERLREAHPDGQVPRPEAWIGYRLVPDYFEFWQGRANRLHDRIAYQPDGDGWTRQRLSP